jgi:hypothetical protein
VNCGLGRRKAVIHLLHIGRIRFQKRIDSLELRFHLVPCERLLRARETGKESYAQNKTADGLRENRY